MFILDNFQYFFSCTSWFYFFAKVTFKKMYLEQYFMHFAFARNFEYITKLIDIRTGLG